MKEIQKRKNIIEIMNNIIDKDLLEERKNEANSKIKEKHKKKNEEIINEKKWWEKPIKKTDFIFIEKNNNFYAQHKEWKKCIWIGPYDSKNEIEEVISNYTKESKKNIMERNITNIHSIIINEKKMGN